MKFKRQTLLSFSVLPAAPIFASLLLAVPHASYAQSGDVCTAGGERLSIAKSNYAAACPSIPREDCDPLADGSWICSSENIVGVTGVPLPPEEPEVPEVPVTPVVGAACTAEGGSLRNARRNYARACSTIPRVDCDLLSTGGWICSSVAIGTTPIEDPIVEPPPIEDPIEDPIVVTPPIEDPIEDPIVVTPPIEDPIEDPIVVTPPIESYRRSLS